MPVYRNGSVTISNTTEDCTLQLYDYEVLCGRFKQSPSAVIEPKKQGGWTGEKSNGFLMVNMGFCVVVRYQILRNLQPLGFFCVCHGNPITGKKYTAVWLYPNASIVLKQLNEMADRSRVDEATTSEELGGTPFSATSSIPQKDTACDQTVVFSQKAAKTPVTRYEATGGGVFQKNGWFAHWSENHTSLSLLAGALHEKAGNKGHTLKTFLGQTHFPTNTDLHLQFSESGLVNIDKTVVTIQHPLIKEQLGMEDLTIPLPEIGNCVVARVVTIVKAQLPQMVPPLVGEVVKGILPPPLLQIAGFEPVDMAPLEEMALTSVVDHTQISLSDGITPAQPRGAAHMTQKIAVLMAVVAFLGYLVGASKFSVILGLFLVLLQGGVVYAGRIIDGLSKPCEKEKTDIAVTGYIPPDIVNWAGRCCNPVGRYAISMAQSLVLPYLPTIAIVLDLDVPIPLRSGTHNLKVHGVMWFDPVTGRFDFHTTKAFVEHVVNLILDDISGIDLLPMVGPMPLLDERLNAALVVVDKCQLHWDATGLGVDLRASLRLDVKN
eukprot:TRINITY_DN82403_c0_g1_i1.p1 TRINITY_DN82403_c0_g1~~TRINITY_DN82403_c0_g1_i1.p1  ORF type:complete len:548 (-),score=87.42 TRINITY_DN82403_c0_g1_i1:8-1651(-)